LLPNSVKAIWGKIWSYEWLYVLSGRLRLLLADHDLVLGAGEAAEFGSTGDGPVEMLSLQGQRMHIRAQPRPHNKPSH
jgi:hypothetical protein